MNPSRAIALALLAPFVWMGGPADAEDADEPTVRRESALELEFIDIADLTAGLTAFRPDRICDIVLRDRVNDEENPLFAGEGEETTKPFGGATDLIDLIRSGVGKRDDWEQEGVSIAAVGERALAMRAPRALIAATEAFVLDRMREAGATVTVDLAVLGGDPAAAAEGGVAAAVARGALMPLGAARACGLVTQRIVGRQGGQSAYVQSYDTIVAEKSPAADPLVGVLSEGVSLDVRASSATTKRILLTIQAQWSRKRSSSPATARDAGAVDLPELDSRKAQALLDVTPGVWTVLSSSGAGSDGVVFAVRATTRPYDVEPRAPLPMPRALLPGPLGPLVVRYHSAKELATKAPSYRGRSIDLTPSRYTPPEPPELPEPYEAFPMESLVDTVRLLVDPPSWTTGGPSIDLKAGTLVVRTDAARQDAVASLFDALRARFVRSTRLRAVVVSMPLASLPEYWMGLDDSSLVADGGSALLSRAGAKVVDRAAVRLAPTQRNAALAGSVRSYVAGYDAKVADSGRVGRPVVQNAFEGTSFDARAPLTGRGAGVVAELRIERATLRATSKTPTPYGEIECPSHGVLRMLGTTVIPLGATRLVSANLDGNDVTLVLVSAAGD